MPAPKPIRIAGKILGAIPFAGDAAVGAAELYNPDEPRAAQRLLNALIVGGGGAAASAATFGADAIPQIAGMFADTPLENLNTETILRRLSYLVGQGRDPGATTGEQIRRIRALGQGVPRERGPAYERVPLKF